jgi:succinate dehydrogenase/fumarate reductase-like Fe-S protein
MPETKTKGEMHGCIVCGKLYQLLIVYDSNGKYIGSKVMSAGGRAVKDSTRPLVACEKHTDEEVKRAVLKVYGKQDLEDD